MEFKDAQMLLNNILSCAEKDPKDLTLYYVMRKYDKEIPFPDLKTGKNLPTRKKVLKHFVEECNQNVRAWQSIITRINNFQEKS
jgi:hypothetical protein